MDIEFHYWITALLAREAGFSEEEASVIAYSSQYVDENDVSYKIRSRIGKPVYRNYISQTMNILKPKAELMRIYPIFHFIPGEPDADSARRRDGKMHILNTTPDNGNANEILSEAFKAPHDTRLYRIGIASHSYADTWAHQNFVGWYDYFNNIGLDIKPDIGHADAEHHPDWVSHIWVDNRLVDSDVNNKLRYLSAAFSLFSRYCEYIRSDRGEDRSSAWEEIERFLVAVWGPTFSGDENIRRENRLEGYRKRLGWLDDFDEQRWFDHAVETDIRGLRDSHDGILSKFAVFKDHYYWRDERNREDTDWFRFQEAVKEHERLSLRLLSPVFAKMGVDLSTA